MRVVVALGGNALLRRGQELSVENQRANISTAAKAIVQVIAAGHQVVITHGNGPQVGLLALQNESYIAGSRFPLDILDSESMGMIGYMLEQEIANLLPKGKPTATILTRVEVAKDDPAFKHPTKPIGPVYEELEAKRIAVANGWTIGRDGNNYRRLVASPAPERILQIEVIQLLVDNGITLICAGGGGIPVIAKDDSSHAGVEAIIDKDRTSALLGNQIKADVLLLLTDIDGVYTDWGKSSQTLIKRLAIKDIGTEEFPAGSMAPKIESAAAFLIGGGRLAAIGRLEDALAMLQMKAGTQVFDECFEIEVSNTR